jgi:phosphohistidine phosphatase
MADPSDLLVERTLVLLRHSKAVRSIDGPDIDRPLAGRGHRDARAAGGWLAERGVRFDLVLCSPAVRTRETWEYAVFGGGQAADVWFDRRIYDADPDTLLDVVHDVPEPAETVLLVGHAPGVPWLARDLVAEGTDGREALVEHFPTSGLAVLQHGRRWSSLGPGDCDLDEYVIPRG